MNRPGMYAAAALLAAACSIPLGCRTPSRAPAPPVAATNSLLECAARDLLGAETPVLRLAEPGMCPGHFDIRPSQVEDLRRCRVLLRFEFQKSLDARLSASADGGLRIVEVRVPGGLCEPRSYLAACSQTADALVSAGLLDRPAADRRLAEIAARLERTAERCRRLAAPLQGAAVVVSTHQEAFCRWLGLRPAAVFAGADTAGIASLDEAVRRGRQAGAKLVIANLPEGRRVADTLTERLGAKVVVFGNFPAMSEAEPSFDSLMENNVQALVKAAKP